jgi:WD40 repeat protein
MLADIRIPRFDRGVRMAFSPVLPILYHTGVRLQIQGYDFETEQVGIQITDFQSRLPYVLAVSPDGGLIVAEDGAELRRWDAVTGQRVGTMQMPAPHPPLSAGFLPGGSFYADDETGMFVLWETAEWQVVDSLGYQGRNDGAFPLPDRTAVVVQFRDRKELSILEWSGELLRAVPTGAEPWRFISLSPDGNQAAIHVDVGLGTEGVLIVDLTGSDVKPRRIPLLNIRALAMSPDWRTLAAVDASSTLRLFNPETGTQSYSQPLEAFRIEGLAISPDGDLLAVYLLREGEDGGRIQVWGRLLP